MTALSQRLRASWTRNYAEWTVIVLVTVALMAGWGVRTYAESQVELYAADGVTIAYPASWLPSELGDGTLRFRDTHAGGVPPSLSLCPASATDPQAAAQAVATEADGLALTRGRDWTAYMTLETANITYRGQPARRVSYTYVQRGANALLQSLPTVMLGEDLVTYQEGMVYVLSLQAPQEEFERVRPRFQAFVNSVAFAAQ